MPFCALGPSGPTDECELRRMSPVIVSNQLTNRKLRAGIHKDVLNVFNTLDHNPDLSYLSTAVSTCSQGELGKILRVNADISQILTRQSHKNVYITE